MRSDAPAPRRAGEPPPSLLHAVSTMTGPALGYAFILAVCVIWVGGSFLVESLEGQGLSPLLLTFICNALFVVLLPAYFLNEWMLMGDEDWRGWGAEGRGGWQRLTGFEGDELATATTTDEARSGGEDGDGGFGGERRDARGSGRRQRRTFSDEELEPDEAPPPASPPRLARARTATERSKHATVRETAWAAFTISPLWFAAQLCFNYSLLYTSVTSNSILSTSSSVFTFGLSVYFVGERYNRERLAAVAAYVLGSALVTLSDHREDGAGSNPTESTNFGNFLTVLAAALYAGYTTAIRYLLPDDPQVSMLLFLGVIGVVNLLGVGAVIVLGHFGLGMFPDVFDDVTPRVFAWACAKGLFDNVLSDYLWARAVLLTSPTVASVGLSMQIPMAALVEAAMGRARWADSGLSALGMLGGCGLVLAGFLGVVYK